MRTRILTLALVILLIGTAGLAPAQAPAQPTNAGPVQPWGLPPLPAGIGPVEKFADVSERTRARRRVCCTNYHVVEGVGYSVVGGQRLDWEDKDVFTVPTWTFCEHVNSGNRPAFLFSFSDVPVMQALNLYREEARS